jgi:hypothetical protein
MIQKVTVNNIEFNSKTKVQEFAKTILVKYAGNDILSKEDQEFMIAYFEQFHYEWKRKNGVGIENVFIKKSEWDNNEFWIKRNDGSTTDVSYIIRKIARPDYKYWLELALGNAIKVEDNKSLKEIVLAFAKEKGITISEELFVANQEQEMVPQLADNTLIEEFITFYAQAN